MFKSDLVNTPAIFNFSTVSELYPDEEKADLLFREASGNREMVSQILQSTFKFQGGGDHSIMCQAGLEVIVREIVNFKKVGFH